MLQSMRSQSAGQEWTTEQQQKEADSSDLITLLPHPHTQFPCQIPAVYFLQLVTQY